MRCQKFGIECNGYPPPPPIRKEPAPKKTSPVVHIVPYIKKEQAVAPAHRPIRMHVGPRFTDQREGQYFQYFREEIAERMTGPLKTSLWNQLVPQASELEPFVGHAVVAIGALSKFQAERANGGFMKTNQHHQYAMFQYGKALQGIRGALAKGTSSMRSTMISCLLVFSFESMQGRQAAAARSGASGLRLLYENYTPTFGRKPPIEDHQQITNNTMEFDLRRVFAEIDLQVLCFLDTRTKEEHDNLKDDINFLLQSMPAEFDNLPECYYYWQLIMRRNLHFSATTRIPLEEEKFNPGENEKDPAVEIVQGNNALCGSSEDMATETAIFRPVLLAERDMCLATIATWQAASTSLFNTILSSEPVSSKTHLSVLLLQIHAAANTIITCGAFFVSELSYDAFFPQFQLIVENCTKIVPYIVNNSSYMSESGILIPLFQVGQHCRNRKLREEAISLMTQRKGYREGIWDAEFVGETCQALWEEEMEWADEAGWVEEGRRARAVGVQGSVEDRWAKLVVLKGMGAGQRPVEVTRVLTW